MTTPPRSRSSHRIRLPQVASRHAWVSTLRDSKASCLPGSILQRATDYCSRSNGFITLHTAPSRGAVTRLSYAVTPGFPRCRQSQTSPLRPMPFLDTMTAYVCGTRPALSIRPVGGFRYPLSLCDRNTQHFLCVPVSASPDLNDQITAELDWVEGSSYNHQRPS